MSKIRVYELASELGYESKDVLAKLQEMGEFVRSASSTIELPVANRLKAAMPAKSRRPVAPYNMDIPYNKNPEAIAPKTKYFMAASEACALSLRSATKA